MHQLSVELLRIPALGFQLSGSTLRCPRSLVRPWSTSLQSVTVPFPLADAFVLVQRVRSLLTSQILAASCLGFAARHCLKLCAHIGVYVVHTHTA